jgi:hypothetical protein
MSDTGGTPPEDPIAWGCSPDFLPRKRDQKPLPFDPLCVIDLSCAEAQTSAIGNTRSAALAAMKTATSCGCVSSQARSFRVVETSRPPCCPPVLASPRLVHTLVSVHRSTLSPVFDMFPHRDKDASARLHLEPHRGQLGVIFPRSPTVIGTPEGPQQTDDFTKS